MFCRPSSYCARKGTGQGLSELDLYPKAAFSLPPGSFAPVTNVPADILIIGRIKAEKMFVAELTKDAAANSQVIDNYRDGVSSSDAALGRGVTIKGFRGLPALRASERLGAASQATGMKIVSLMDLAHCHLMRTMTTCLGVSRKHSSASIRCTWWPELSCIAGV